MNEQLTALKLLLEQLQVPISITTVHERKYVQKAVYLGQLSGVDLGYRYGWYIMGPYSTSLTRDYFQMAEELEADTSAFAGKKLRTDAAEKLNRILPMLEIPEELIDKGLDRNDWFELLASYHYLRKFSNESHEAAKQLLAIRKPHLAPFVKVAAKALRDHNLLSV